MSTYYIEVLSDQGDELFALDSTSSVVVNNSGTITSFPLDDGSVVSDHYKNNNTTVSFRGVITDIKSAARVVQEDFRKTTQDFLTKLQKLKDSGEPFNVVYSNKLPKIESCVFESLTWSQDNVRGHVDKAGGGSGFTGLDSFNLNFTAKQVRFGTRAQLTNSKRRDPFIELKTAEKLEKGGDKEEFRVTPEVRARLLSITPGL